MKIYLFDAQTSLFIEESEATSCDPPGSWYYPLNATTEPPPDLPEGKAARWSGFAWEVVDLPPPPTLEEIKAARIAEINANTSRLILAGFDYAVGGETYHFGYNAEDQGNITKATLAATLSIVGQQPFAQPWRGWIGDTPHTLTLDAQGMIALATFAGVNHQQGYLATGWALTEQVRNAAAIEEVEAIVDDRE